jgi:hypothetical protein
MNRLNIFNSTTAIPASRFSSRTHPVATITGLQADADGQLTSVMTASAGTSGLHRARRAPSQKISARRLVWFTLQPALSVGGIAATHRPSHRSVADKDSLATAPAAAVWPSFTTEESLSPATARSSVESATPTLATERAYSEMTPPLSSAAASAPAAAAPPAKAASAISRIELAIDSLRTYDLVRPIPVVVEVLGERNYVAEMPDLNISISASNQSDIIIILKERIAQIYDGLRLLKHLDVEQSRQLRVLESYIAKTRRGWLDRR